MEQIQKRKPKRTVETYIEEDTKYIPRITDEEVEQLLGKIALEVE